MVSDVSRNINSNTGRNPRTPIYGRKWLPHLLKKSQKINACIKVINTWTIQQQQENEKHIMDVLIDNKNINANQVMKADYMRKFLQVTTIADITSLDGTTIIPEILKATSKTSRSFITITNMNWPRQVQPSRQTREIWTSALRAIICNKRGTLYQPLGNWYSNAEKR
eukprot:5444701-Ditylum_brightwellii.AAC.1